MRMAKIDSASWKQLADEKEKEWRGILESRIETLENEYREKEKELASERVKFNELKEHFKYNLKLIEDRDKELEKYDISFTELRTSLNAKNAEISELKIHLDDLKNVIKREEKSREELQVNYQRRLREKQAEVDSYKSSKDGEIQEERKEYEQFRRNLQRQLTNVQNELDTQRTELTTEFENAMKKREHEFRVQCDELNAKVLEHELKAKLLQKELELSRESNDKTIAHAEEAESTQREVEKLLKQKEWELADMTAIKDSQIAELQSKLSSSEAAMKKMQEDFQRKYTEMDKLARDREDAIERAKNGYLEKEQALQAANQELQSKLEDAQIKERQLTWSNQDLVKDKETQIERLQEEVNDVKERWDRHVAEIARDNVGRDLELSTALEEQRRLKLELEQRKDDLQRYKKELKSAAEREEKLDKSKTQTELDWQRRCEDLERQQYDKSEDLIKKLTTARNEAQALVKERERELHHKILLVKSLHRERDQLRALLKKHDIPLDNFVRFSLDESAEEEEMNYVEDLQKQNAGLKQLIAQMTLQMESLGQDAPKIDAKYNDDNSSVYEDEIRDLRQQNKELKEKLKSSRKVFHDTPHVPSAKDHEDVLSQVEGNTAVKNHILALNGAIGSLRSEKVDLAATVKKQQARLAYLENSLEEVSKQPRQKQIQIDQLTYELSSCRRRHEGEVTGLKNRVSELELQLSEARREADEYHRASLERNEELVALGNQLSALKMEMSESNPSINFGAQELYIQQLQNELSQLRKRAAAVDHSDMENIESKFSKLGEGSSSSDLKHKLRMAASRIVQLAKENQQLMESNNRLRAELNAAISDKKSPQDIPMKPKSHKQVEDDKDNSQPGQGRGQSSGSAAMQDRLAQLEKLQYQLTRQELKFAHRFKAGDAGDSLPSAHTYYDNTQEPERDSDDANVKNQIYSKNPYTANTRSTSPGPALRPSSRDIDPRMLASMSSGGGDSIQKVWQMLEDAGSSVGASSPRSPRSVLAAQNKTSGQKSPDQRSGVRQHANFDGGDVFHLEGQPVPAVSKSARGQSGRSAGMKYAENVKKPTQAKPKIRNYNVKDDSSRR